MGGFFFCKPLCEKSVFLFFGGRGDGGGGVVAVNVACYFGDSLASIIIFDGTFGTYKWLHFVTSHSGFVTLGILRYVASINYLSRNT